MRETDLTKIISSAYSRQVDTVIRNARVVNVFSGEIRKADVAILGDVIVGVGEPYDAKGEIDAHGGYLCPGLMDSHAQIESTLLTPESYARLLIRNGTTGIIADPQKIMRLCGTEGIRWLMARSAKLPIHVYCTLPFSFPGLSVREMEELLQNERILGFTEASEGESILQMSDEMLDKMEYFSGRHIDGRAPGLGGYALNAYCAAGVGTERGYINYEEMRDRIRRGIKVQLSYGENTENIVRRIVQDRLPTERMMLCSDGISLQDMQAHGHINWLLGTCVACGLHPIEAIRMATSNIADTYRLERRGAIAPGYIADMVLFHDLESFQVDAVIRNGKIYAEGSAYQKETTEPLGLRACANGKNVRDVSLTKGANVLRIDDAGHILTESGRFGGAHRSAVRWMVLRRGNAERKKPKVGALYGMPIQGGAIGTTQSYYGNCVNLAGDNAEDILLAARTLEETGGYVVVSRGRIVARLPLPIAGLMSEETPEQLAFAKRHIARAAKQLGCVSERNIFDILSELDRFGDAQ